MQDLIVARLLQWPGATVGTSHEFTASVEHTQKDARPSLPKARLRVSTARQPTPDEAPNLFEDSRQRFHVTPRCPQADAVADALLIFEPCSNCINPKSLARGVLYRTVKGKK